MTRYLLEKELRENAAKINSGRGMNLDEHLLGISEKAHKETVENLGADYRNIDSGLNVGLLLQLCGGSLKGLNVLELGCGDGHRYAPYFSETLHRLGAKVTGVDLGWHVENPFEFDYVTCNLMNEMHLEDEHRRSGLLKGKDIVIAKGLLHNGLKYGKEERDFVAYYQGFEAEWDCYSKLINKVRENNDRTALHFLEIPFNFPERIHEVSKEILVPGIPESSYVITL